MDKCIDKSLGRLLHDYEMGWLSEEDLQRFELHLMDCRFCFGEAEKFKQAARLLISDEDVRTTLMSVERRAGIWSHFIRNLWPEGNLLLKPAFAYLGILILLPLAFIGVYHQATDDNSVRPVHTLELVSTRGPLRTVHVEDGKGLVLSFGFAGAVSGQHYRVILKSKAGDILWQDQELSFDARQRARLLVPHGLLNRGEHMIIIQDLEDSSPLGTDTLRFLVED